MEDIKSANRHFDFWALKKLNFKEKKPFAPQSRSISKRKASIICFLIIAFVLWIILGFFKTATSGVNDAYQEFETASVFLGDSLISENVPEINLSFKEIVSLIKNLPKVTKSVISFRQDINSLKDTGSDLKNNGLSWIFNDGEKLINNLGILSKNIVSINTSSEELRNIVAEADSDNNISKRYLDLQIDIARAEDGLSSLVSLLEKGSRFIVIFENTSEIRPAGGFNGSYADLVIKSGQIQSIEVQDIFYPDKNSNLKIIPPKPLQLIATSWGARDANWFFDFPTSAEKTLYFIENSGVYKNSHFDGVITVNTNFFKDILEATGPIEMPEFKTTLDKDNFLSEIQKEVAITSYGKGDERKSILKLLLPRIIDRLTKLDLQDKDILAEQTLQALKTKEIKLYFRDNHLETLASRLGFDGKVIPTSEEIDYLSFSAANIGGSKTDAVMGQKAEINIKINESGIVDHNLKIIRSHRGDKERLPFYRLDNQIYMKVMIPKLGQIVSIKGNTDKKIYSKINYRISGYQKDKEAELSDNGEESGNKVFGFWQITKLGRESTSEINYSLEMPITKSYEFVYQRQSGISSSLKYKIEAPAGMVFKDSKRSLYEGEFGADESIGRIKLDLEPI